MSRTLQHFLRLDLRSYLHDKMVAELKGQRVCYQKQRPGLKLRCHSRPGRITQDYQRVVQGQRLG